MLTLVLLSSGWSVYLATTSASSLLGTRSPSATQDVVGPRRPTLFVEPMNGLSNRLRAIASGRALARASGRRLVIVWKPDVQCNISLTRLIDVDETILDTFVLSPDTSLRYYSNPRDVVRVADDADPDDVYIRTPFILNADVPYKHLLAREFRALRPTARIVDMVSAMEHDVGGDHEIAVHIRMLSNFTEDVPGASATLTGEFSRHAIAYRENCHWRHFVDPLRYVGASHRTVTFDSDVPEASTRLRDTLRNGRALAQTCVGRIRRQSHCIEVAFAHILFMARSSILLLSHWSSYSELVRWLAPRHSIAVNGCRYTPATRDWVRTSIVIACRDRETVATVVQNALRVSDNATEVVVVDWSSRQPIRLRRHRFDPRVRVIRVEDVSQWNIAQAYNVGFRHASGDRILKIDCDTRLACMPAPPVLRTTFHTGNWRVAGHLNGIVDVSRDAIERVGGYDERLYRYGWDDDDLYRRIEQHAGLMRRDMNVACIHHIPHANRLRGVSGVVDGLISTQRNRLCIGNQLWNATSRTSSYRSMYNERERLLQVWRPDPIESVSRTCDERLATATVLFHLFSECTVPGCRRHFWTVSSEKWATTREFMMRLVPTHSDDAVACERDWPSFVRPSTVRTCAATLAHYNAFVRAKT